MKNYQEKQWHRMVAEAKDHSDPLIEDEVIVAVDKDLQRMYDALFYIANDWVESSFDKVMAQRSDFIKIARAALTEVGGRP